MHRSTSRDWSRNTFGSASRLLDPLQKNVASLSTDVKSGAFFFKSKSVLRDLSVVDLKSSAGWEDQCVPTTFPYPFGRRSHQLSPGDNMCCFDLQNGTWMGKSLCLVCLVFTLYACPLCTILGKQSTDLTQSSHNWSLSLSLSLYLSSLSFVLSRSLCPAFPLSLSFSSFLSLSLLLYLSLAFYHFFFLSFSWICVCMGLW